MGNTVETHEQFCPNCEDYRQMDLVSIEETYTIRKEDITVPVETFICTTCGETVNSDERDQQVLDTVYAEYRRRADLLTPEEIKKIRNQYSLSQKSFAALLGMSEATINRYEQGKLQDKTHDSLIRACKSHEVMQDILNRQGDLLSERQLKRVQNVLSGQSEIANNVTGNMENNNWSGMPEEVSDKTGNRLFEYTRYAQVVLWFCSRIENVSRTSINKLMFYVDFLHYRHETVSLTGSAYRRAPFGPVPADFDGLLSQMEAEGLLVREERAFPGGYVGHYYKPGPRGNSITIDFSAYERRVLEQVKCSIGSMSAKGVSDKSHQETAWIDTEDGQFISYTFANRLSLTLPD